MVEATSLPGLSPDPGDDKFLACAIAANAEVLVTGNKRHFPEGQFRGTKVVSAAELLEFITLGI
jgi:predicted nucleic acid-binding protein